MREAVAAPIAKLRELDFALYFLFIFARPIVDALALGTLEFYQIILRHMNS